MGFGYDIVKQVLDEEIAKSGNKFVPFDVQFYREHYSVVRAPDGTVIDDSLSTYEGDPLQHYVEFGAARGYAPNAWFDAAFYQQAYDDVGGLSGADLLVHYARFGAYEGRATNAVLEHFDGERYLLDYPDVAAYVQANLADFLGSVTNGAIAHYVLYGAAEQREAYTTDGVSVTNRAPATDDASAEMARKATYTFKVADFPFDDPDAQDSLAAVVITRLPDNGTLTLGGVPVAVGATVTAAQLASGALKFKPANDFIGDATFGFKVRDQALESEAAQFTLSVVNAAPVTEDEVLFLDPRGALKLNLSNFAFSDTDGDSLTTVTLTSVPLAGTLRLDGVAVTVGQIQAGLHISAARIAAGALEYVAPASGYQGLMEFGFRVNDGHGSSEDARVQLVVGNVAPSTGQVEARIEKDQAYVFKAVDFPWSDLNADDALSAVIITSVPGRGQLFLDGKLVTGEQAVTVAQLAAGALRFVPQEGYQGPVGFLFRVSDGELSSAEARFGFVVGNRAPTTAAGQVAGQEDQARVFAVGDFPFADLDGDDFEGIEIVSLPARGQLKLGNQVLEVGAVVSRADIASGALRFIPDQDAHGTVTFEFRVSDGDDSSAAATMSIVLAPVNDAPVAVNGTTLVAADAAYALRASDFRFTDVDGDALAEVKLLSLPSSGQWLLDGVALQAGATVSRADLDAGRLVYQPVAGFNGLVALNFSVGDGQATSGAGTLTLAVGNQAPTTEDGQVRTPAGQAIVLSAADFGFSDLNGDALASVTVETLPAQGGRLMLAGQPLQAGTVVTRAQLDGGQLRFEPTAGFTGETQFGFKVSDGSLSSASATMDVLVGNSLPSTADASVQVNEDQVLTLSLQDFPYSDAESDPLLQVRIVSLPGDGQLLLKGAAVQAGDLISRAQLQAGELTFRPDANFHGEVRFDFQVVDVSGASDAATMTVEVQPVNDLPVAQAIRVAGTEDVTYRFKVADFPFDDADDDALGGIVVQSLPASGRLLLDGVAVKAGDVILASRLGSLTYEPASNATGTVQFSFRVRDEAGGTSEAATATIDLAPVQDLPQARPSGISVDTGERFVFSAGVFGFTDPDAGDTLQSVKILSLPAKGKLQLGGKDVTVGTTISAADLAAGRLTYSQDWPERSSFTFSVSDGKGDSAAATMEVAVDASLTLVSKNVNGGSLVLDSIDPEISADGRYVVFTASSSNLVAGDANIVPDVYLRDMQTGVTTLVSIGANGVSNGASGRPSISSDGKVVVFSSLGSNLVSGDTNQVRDIFAYDTTTKTLKLVSTSKSSVLGNGNSDQPVISGNGKVVAFTSVATNLGSADVNPNGEIFVKNLATGTVERATTGINGAQANGASNYAHLNQDGTIVTFESLASNLVSGDTNGVKDVFIRKNGKTELVSKSQAGVAGNGNSFQPLITSSGDKVAFTSLATNLTSGDSNGVADVFLKNLSTGAVVRISESSTGQQANGASTLLSISADGRYVAFSSTASNLVAGDTNGVADLFIKDTVTQAVTRVSVSDSGVQGNGPTTYADLSGDGAFLTFASDASNLIADDKNTAYDVFWGAWGG